MNIEQSIQKLVKIEIEKLKVEVQAEVTKHTYIAFYALLSKLDNKLELQKERVDSLRDEFSEVRTSIEKSKLE